MIGAASNFDLPTTEGEIGYWIGVLYWGQGLVPEAVSRRVPLRNAVYKQKYIINNSFYLVSPYAKQVDSVF